MFNDPIMHVINTCLPYKERREVLNIMAESAVMKESVYNNIGNYFMKSIASLKPIDCVRKYNACNGKLSALKGFETTEQCNLVLTKSSIPNVSKNALIVEEAIRNLRLREKNLNLGIKVKDSSVCKIIFGCVAKLIVASVSLNIIDTGAPYGGPSSKPVGTHLSITGLSIFNEYCKNGIIDKVIRMDLGVGVREAAWDEAQQTENMFTLFATIGGAFITAIRSSVYWVYYTRMDLAEYLEQQAAYLEINKLQLKNRTDLTDAEKKEIIRKQTEWQRKLLDLSDKIQIDDIKAAKKAEDKAKKDEKEITINDTKNDYDNPTSTNTSSSSDEPDFF